MKNNQTKLSYISKHLPIDCTNDAMMVREGIRVPMLEQVKFDRSSKQEIKEAIKLRTKTLKKSLIAHEENVMQICLEFNKLMENSKLNITKFQIMKS